ncbi:Terminase small subunit, partial [Dysosmobacter welbionis]
RPADRSPFRRDVDCLCRVSVLYARHRMGDPVPAPLSRLHRHYPGRRLPAVHDEVHDDRGGHQSDPGPYLYLSAEDGRCGRRDRHGDRAGGCWMPGPALPAPPQNRSYPAGGPAPYTEADLSYSGTGPPQLAYADALRSGADYPEQSDAGLWSRHS